MTHATEPAAPVELDFVAILAAVSLDALVVVAPQRQGDSVVDFVVLWANEATGEMVRRDAASLVGSGYRQIFPDGGPLFDALVAAARTGTPHSGELEVRPPGVPITHVGYRIAPVGDVLALSVVDLTETAAARARARRLDELHRSSARFSTVNAAVFRPVLGKDGAVVDLIFDDVNERAAALLGLGRMDVIGRPVTDFVSRRQGGMVDAVADCWLRQEPLSFELDVRPLPIEVDFLQVQLTPLPDAVVAHADDVSERRNEELALRASEWRYRTLFETASEAIGIVDLQGTFALGNDAMAALLGVSAATLVGCNLSAFMDDEELEETRSWARRAIRTGVPTPPRRIKIVRGDGTTRWVFAATNHVHDQDGRHTGFLLMVLDIDDAVRSEAALRASESRYRVLVEGAEAVILLVDHRGTVQFANREVFRVLGYDPAALVGLPVLPLYAPEVRDTSMRTFESLRSGRADVARYRVEVLAADGRRIPMAGSAAALRAEDGAFEGMVLIGTDISVMVEQENSRRELGAALAVAEQQERQRLALALHDGPVQRLSALSMRLGAATATGAAPLQLLELAEDVTRRTITELRGVMFQLTPPDLEGMGFARALADRASRLLEPATEVVLDNRWRSQPDEATAHNMLRIAHEAVVNVAKHARADRLRIALQETDTDFIVELDDDGIGGDPTTFLARYPDHLGVRSMVDRARQLGGVCEISAEPGGGTSVFIRLPKRTVTAVAAD